MADMNNKAGDGEDALVIASVHMAVRDRIRRDMLRGTLSAGERLQQSELARRYGVSVTPVREALRDLAGEGLVDFNPFSGATVHQPTVQELEQIYEIRSTLLPLAVRDGIANMTPAVLGEAEELAKMMETEATPESWVEYNRQFHHVLDDATRNVHLANILRRLADVSTLYVNLSVELDQRRHEANQEHRAILEAYRRGEVEGATDQIVAHIAHTLRATRSIVAALPTPTEDGRKSRRPRSGRSET